MSAPFQLVMSGDSCVIVEFPERIDEAVNAQAVQLADEIRSAAISGVRDVVATFRSVAVYFDPLRTDLNALTRRLEGEARAPAPAAARTMEPIRIPVQYGGTFGPDLADVARFAGVTEQEAIAIHVKPTYRVFMLGFLPGFAYLGTVDARIAAPRRATPRTRVPAGSVGIAGPQTGIYPRETPGGWQLVGRTDTKLFDLDRAEPFLLKAGDMVQFYAVSGN